MRELKFRAWDKKRNIMIGEDYPDNWGSEKQEYWADVFEISLTGITEITQNARFEIMQYTGLRDKNEKEIYEGDVVEIKGEEYYSNESFCTEDGEWMFSGEIAMNSLMWMAINRDSTAIPLCDLLHGDMEIDIIGNVFENPELIKNDK